MTNGEVWASTEVRENSRPRRALDIERRLSTVLIGVVNGAQRPKADINLAE